MATILGAAMVGLLALTGIVIGAHYASLRLLAQIDEQRRWEDERRVEDARRLQTQLDAESERHLRQLDADSERLERQLDHDRRMRDRDALRLLLDEGVRISHETADLGIDFEIYQEAEPPRDPRDAAALHKRKAALSESQHRFWRRLTIRFNPTDDLPEVFSALDEALSKRLDAIGRAINGEATEDDDLPLLADEMRQAQTEVLRICRIALAER